MSEPNALLGSLLGDKYRLVELVGHGGMATVLKAEDVRHHRLVAVKIFRSDVARLGGPDRFAREIAILATLQHPNILPLLDSGTIDGQPYYVMPFVQGESLRERLRRDGRLPVPDAVRILVEVVDALRYAHELGIVHRDIKPENVLLSGRHALLADFGIARSTSSGDPRTTTAGMALGTPAYMAPEQAAGDPAIDARADLYAVGVLGFEMMAGRPPFISESPAALLAAHVIETPPPLDELRVEVPRALASVIAKCLAKRPGDRWTSAGALAEHLEPFLLPSGAVTPVPTQRIEIRTRRWPYLVGAAAAGLIGVAGALLFRQPSSQVSIAATRRLGVSEQLELDPVVSPDGKLLAYASGTNGSMRVMVRQMAGGDAVTLAESVGGNQRMPQWLPDGNHVVFQAQGSLYQVPALGGSADVLVEGGPGEPVENGAWSPDGTSLAFTRAGVIWIQEGVRGQPRELARDGEAHSLAWSPDGRWLAYVSGNRDYALGEALLGNIAPSVIKLIRIEPDRRQEPISLTDGRTLAASPAWLDRRRLAYVANPGGLRDLFMIELGRDGRPRPTGQRLTTGLNAHSVRTAPGGRLTVAVLQQVSNIWAVPIPARGTASIAEATSVTRGNQVIEDLDVLPGGRWLAFDSNQHGNQDIYLQSLRSGRPTQITRDSTDEFGPAWSPNGKEIAFYGVRDGVRHVFVMRANGRDIRQVTRDTLGDHQPHWAPDGEALVFYRRDRQNRDFMYSVRRRADSTWDEPRLLSTEPGTATTWSPDGGSIAFGDAAGRVSVLPLAGGPSRVVAQPEDVGGDRLKRPTWVPAEAALLARAERAGGLGGIWWIPLGGGKPREIIRFDDPKRPVYRDDFTTDGERVYFNIALLEGSLWLLDLSGGRS